MSHSQYVPSLQDSNWSNMVFSIYQKLITHGNYSLEDWQRHVISLQKMEQTMRLPYFLVSSAWPSGWDVCFGGTGIIGGNIHPQAGRAHLDDLWSNHIKSINTVSISRLFWCSPGYQSPRFDRHLMPYLSIFSHIYGGISANLPPAIVNIPQLFRISCWRFFKPWLPQAPIYTCL